MNKLKIRAWLNEVGELVPSSHSKDFIWVTKARGDYITLEGLEDKPIVEALVERGITHHVSSIWEAGKPINIGFNPITNMWYGWSHRAIYGFGVGSTCKKGDFHYRPVDMDDFLDDCRRFWEDEYHVWTEASHMVDYVVVSWLYNNKVPNEKIRGTIGETQCHYPKEYGKGGWIAKTLAEAREMAIDFAGGVADAIKYIKPEDN